MSQVFFFGPGFGNQDLGHLHLESCRVPRESRGCKGMWGNVLGVGHVVSPGGTEVLASDWNGWR